MKFFISILLVAALSFAACLFLPWWVIAIAGFITALAIPQGAVRAFFSGFLGVFILWTGLCFWISSANDHLFAHKISVLILKIDSPALLMFVTGLIGGLVAGFGSLSGSLLRAKRS